MTAPGNNYAYKAKTTRPSQLRMVYNVGMLRVLILVVLLVPGLSLAQNLPNEFTCEDLIDYTNGKVSSARKQPQPKNQYDRALLEYDVQLCRRLQRKEITVAEFNSMQATKLRELTEAKRKAEAERDPINRQLNVLNEQRQQEAAAAARAQREAARIQAERAKAQREALARVQAERARQAQAEQARLLAQQGQGGMIFIDPPQQQQTSSLNTYDSQNQLIHACGAKGFAVDFVSGNCVSPQGAQINPHNLYPPHAAPLPMPSPNDLRIRCAAMGRVPNFSTGQCM